MSKRQSWNIIILFGLMIFGFTIVTFVKPVTEYSETENRTLAQSPRLSFETIMNGEYEADYEDYLTDQFFARDSWIGLKTMVERFLLRQDSKDIYFAKDDYLIEKHTGVFESQSAERNIQTLKQFLEMYEEKFGKEHMTVMIVPNAVDILRDKLPALASPYDEELYLTQIQESIPSEIWFDTSEVLSSHAQEEIYYRTDHHWKTKAAFYVYQKWAEKNGLPIPTEEDYNIETVTEEFWGTIQSKLGIDRKADSIELYKLKSDPLYTVRANEETETSYSLYYLPALETKSKYDVFFGGNHAMDRITTKAGTGKRLLIIKDSYAHCFVPFLLEDFDEIDLVDVRYYNNKLSDLISTENYTDIMFLYNAAGFAEETSISRIIF